MSISTLLDVAISLSFLYLLLAVICSAVTEAVSTAVGLRAATLKKGIERLLHSKRMAARVYDHPLVDGLTKDSHSYPAYIPSDLFARALVDVIGGWEEKKGGADEAAVKNSDESSSKKSSKNIKKKVAEVDDDVPTTAGIFREVVALAWSALTLRLRQLFFRSVPRARPCPKGPKDRKELLKKIEALPPEPRTALIAVLDDENIDSLDKVRAAIVTWFDRGMESVSGWYKRSAQVVICTVALGISILLNVDTFHVADSLSRDALVRTSVVTAIQESAKRGPVDLKQNISQARKELEAVGLPIGWPADSPKFCSSAMVAQEPAIGPVIEACDPRAVTLRGLGRKIGGWLFTTIAISLGAPFWFDVFNRLINLRSAARPAEKKPEDAPKPEATASDAPAREEKSDTPPARDKASKPEEAQLS